MAKPMISDRDRIVKPTINPSVFHPNHCLFPINFSLFGKLNSLIQALDATLLFSKILFDLFCCTQPNPMLYTTREALGSPFGYGKKKVTRLLKHLESKHLIDFGSALWWGEKRLKISLKIPVDGIPIHLAKFQQLVELLGSVKTAILFSKIAFASQGTKITHHQKRWCTLTQTQLANWVGMSIRSIDRLIQPLIEKGFLLKQNFQFNGSKQTHYHLTRLAETLLNAGSEKGDKWVANRMPAKVVLFPSKPLPKKIIHSPTGKTHLAKMTFSLKKETKQKNNNTRIIPKLELREVQETGRGEINVQSQSLDEMKTTLTPRQESYLMSALNRTCQRHHLTPSNPKHLLDEIRFFIRHPIQRSGITTFTHAVNRAMTLLRDRNWRTPKGFAKFSDVGQGISQERMHREADWQTRKQEEIEQGRQSPILAVVSAARESQHIREAEALAQPLLDEIKRLKRLERSKAINRLIAQQGVENRLGRLYGLLRRGLSADWLKEKIEDLSNE